MYVSRIHLESGDESVIVITVTRLLAGHPRNGMWFLAGTSDLSRASRKVLGPTQLPIQWVREFSGQTTDFTTHLRCQGSEWVQLYLHLQCVCCPEAFCMHVYVCVHGWMVRTHQSGGVETNTSHYSCWKESYCLSIWTLSHTYTHSLTLTLSLPLSLPPSYQRQDWKRCCLFTCQEYVNSALHVISLNSMHFILSFQFYKY